MQMTGKNNRILDLYARLMNGETISKRECAGKYGVNEKSVQRDFNDIRSYFAMKLSEEGCGQVLIYDRREGGYRLEAQGTLTLSNSEILAVCKILLDSRSMTKSEMMQILNKLVYGCVPRKNMKLVHDLISNEAYHYIEPQHHKPFLDKMWDIGQAIQESRVIEITYSKRNGEKVTRRLEPLAIMFSEYYFYMTAFLENVDRKQFAVIDDSFPTIYRIDRIESLKVTKDHFHNSENAFSSWSAEDSGESSSGIKDRLWKLSSTDCQLRKSSGKPSKDFSSKRKCSAMEWICG